MSKRSDRRLAFLIFALTVFAWWFWPWSAPKGRPATKWIKGRQTACAMPCPPEPTVWLVVWDGATA